MSWVDALKSYDLICSTRTAGWPGIIVDEVQPQHSTNQLADHENELPAVDAHLIGLTVAGKYGLHARVGSTQYTGPAQPGTLSLVPAGMQSRWRHSRHLGRKAAIWVPHRLVIEAAEEMFVGSAHGAEILPALGTRNLIIENLVAVMMSELGRPTHPAQKLIFNGASIALAAEIVRQFGSRSRREQVATGRLSRRALAAVTCYINGHVHERIGLAELARIAGLGRSHFIRLFRNSTGLTPMAYLERSRIARATDLLRSRELRISEIAHATGFSDQSHFTRRFRAHIGVTPGAYRQTIRET